MFAHCSFERGVRHRGGRYAIDAGQFQIAAVGLSVGTAGLGILGILPGKFVANFLIWNLEYSI